MATVTRSKQNSTKNQPQEWPLKYLHKNFTDTSIQTSLDIQSNPVHVPEAMMYTLHSEHPSRALSYKCSCQMQ